MKKVLTSLLLLLAHGAYAANGIQTGTVHDITVRASDGLIVFNINGAAKSGGPACAALAYWMIRDENSNVGKQQYAVLLAALSSGKTVTITGLGTCLRWPDGEDVNSVLINE